MTIAELLDAAKRAQGSLTTVAQKLDVPLPKLSEWRKGKYKPDATYIAELAELAGLPVFQTLAAIETTLEANRSSVWVRALGNLRATGVAAALLLGVIFSFAIAPKPANAAPPEAHCLHTAGVTGSIPVLPTRFMGM